MRRRRLALLALFLLAGLAVAFAVNLAKVDRPTETRGPSPKIQVVEQAP